MNEQPFLISKEAQYWSQQMEPTSNIEIITVFDNKINWVLNN